MANRGGNKALGEYVRTRRESRNLDFRTVADHSGLHHSFWRKLEAGQYESPDPKRLQRIAETISCPVEDLYSLCGYPVPAGLPSFGPYLRATTNLAPQDIALMTRMLDSLDHTQTDATDTDITTRRSK